MKAVATNYSKEVERRRQELFQELDKGICDMRQGDVIPHDEAMKQIREELGLYNV